MTAVDQVHALTAAGQLLRELLGSNDEAIVRLFAHGEPTRAAEFAADVVTSLESASLIRQLAEEITPLVRIERWGDLFIAHDADGPADIGPETVLGVNNTTRALASLTPRTAIGRALDVATGPGGLALLLARHSEVVVATDLSAEALRFARLNAVINDVELDIRGGDLYGPIAGDKPFDLITGNLPFVVSPDSSFTFRDGGRERDGMSREAVVGAVAHLAPGGTAVLMCNWIVPRGSQAAELPLDWLASTEASAVVLHHSTELPDEYAERWNRFLLAQDPAAYAATIERWTIAFDSWGIQGIANGAVVLRRDATGLVHRSTMTMQRVPSGDGGAQLNRILANSALLARSDERAVLTGSGDDRWLLASRLALVSPHRLEQSMAYDGSWSAEPAWMVLADSAGVLGEVDPLAVHVLLRLDGLTPLASLIDTTADETGIDVDELRRSTVTTLCDLLNSGCLEVSLAPD